MIRLIPLTPLLPCHFIIPLNVLIVRHCVRKVKYVKTHTVFLHKIYKTPPRPLIYQIYMYCIHADVKH